MSPPDCACGHYTLNPEPQTPQQGEFFIDKLLVRVHLIIVMIRWTGLAPWEFEFSFPGGRAFTFLASTILALHSEP